MTEQDNNQHLEREQEDRELARRLDLEYLEHMIESMPKKKQTEKIAVVGPRAFSMRDMLEEIRGDGPHAETLRSMLREIRLARFRQHKQ